jgi:ATP/maltotriose-dependent transcriptional regulator MalT
MALVGLGDPETGMAEVGEGLRMMREMGAWLVYPSCLMCLAQSQLMSGRLDEASATVEEAVRLMGVMRTRHNLPVLAELRGEIRLLRGEVRAALEAFEQALGEARSLGAVLQGLRMSVRMAVVLKDLGETARAREVLDAACASAPADEVLPDLQAARGLLAGLS